MFGRPPCKLVWRTCQVQAYSMQDLTKYAKEA